MKTHYRVMAAVALGILVGGIPTHFYYRDVLEKTSRKWVMVGHTSLVMSDLVRLKALKRGDTDFVIGDMEEEVSSEIWCLALTFPEEVLSDPHSLGILGRAAAYRRQNPYQTGDADKDRLVEELLAKAGAGKDPTGSVVERGASGPEREKENR